MHKDQTLSGALRRVVTEPKQLGLAFLFFLFLAWLIGWQMSLILMGVLMFHEIGHAWAMHRYRVPIQGFYFMPPVGLAVVAAERWPDRKAESVIALMGPGWGLLLTAVFYVLHLATDSALLAGLAGYSALINLFNLAPINPLDGGRVTKSLAHSIHPTFGLVFQGLGLAAALVAGYCFNFLLIGILVAWFGYVELRRELRDRELEKSRDLVLRSLAEQLQVEPDADAVLTRLRQRRAQDDGFSVSLPPAVLAYVSVNTLARMDDADLERWLRGALLPPLRPRHIGLFFGLYTLLAAALYWFMTASWQVMGFMDLLRYWT